MGRFSRVTKPGGSGSGGTTEVEYVPTIVESTTAITHANDVHALGDVLGGLLTLTSAVTEAAFAKIVSVTLTNATGEIPGVDVVFLHSDLTSGIADSAAWDLAAGDHDHVLATVPIYASEWVQSDTASVAEKNPGNVIQLTGTSLYAYIVNRGTSYTPASTSGYDLTVRLEQY